MHTRYQMLRDQQRDRLEVDRVDQLRRVQQLGDGDHARQRGRLQHRDRLVAGRRDDHAHRLRQHDPPQRLHPRHAQRLRGVGLALIDGDDPRPDDLGHVGALVEAEAEDRSPEGGDQGVGVGVHERRAERDAERRSSGTARRCCTRTAAARARACRGRTRCRASSHATSSGFGDSRMTASTTPSAMPITIAITVSSIVTTSPSRMRLSNRYSPTTPHSKPGLVDDRADQRRRDDDHDRRRDPAPRAAHRDGPDLIGPSRLRGDLGRGHRLPSSSSRR